MEIRSSASAKAVDGNTELIVWVTPGTKRTPKQQDSCSDHLTQRRVPKHHNQPNSTEQQNDNDNDNNNNHDNNNNNNNNNDDDDDDDDEKKKKAD